MLGHVGKLTFGFRPLYFGFQPTVSHGFDLNLVELDGAAIGRKVYPLYAKFDNDQCIGAITGICKLEAVVFVDRDRSEEHTSELQSLMRSSYAVLCLKKKIKS